MKCQIEVVRTRFVKEGGVKKNQGFINTCGVVIRKPLVECRPQLSLPQHASGEATGGRKTTSLNTRTPRQRELWMFCLPFSFLWKETVDGALMTHTREAFKRLSFGSLPRGSTPALETDDLRSGPVGLTVSLVQEACTLQLSSHPGKS